MPPQASGIGIAYWQNRSLDPPSRAALRPLLPVARTKIAPQAGSPDNRARSAEHRAARRARSECLLSRRGSYPPPFARGAQTKAESCRGRAAPASAAPRDRNRRIRLWHPPFVAPPPTVHRVRSGWLLIPRFVLGCAKKSAARWISVRVVLRYSLQS